MTGILILWYLFLQLSFGADPFLLLYLFETVIFSLWGALGEDSLSSCSVDIGMSCPFTLWHF